MEFSVIFNSLDDLSNELRHNAGLLNEISTVFNETCFELVNEIESEITDEISIAIDEIKEKSERVLLDFNKHVNFIETAYNDYVQTENYALTAAESIRCNLYSSPGSYVPSVGGSYVPPQNFPRDFVVMLPEWLPYIPVSKPGERERKKKNIVIPDFFSKINTIPKDTQRKILAGIFVNIAPGAIIAGILNIRPHLPGSFDSVINSSYFGKGEGSDGAMSEGWSSLLESMLNEVGNAYRENYNLIRAWMASAIINYIVSLYTFISEFVNYQTLGNSQANTGNDTTKDAENNDDEKSKTDDEDLQPNSGGSVGGGGGGAPGGDNDDDREDDLASNKRNVSGVDILKGGIAAGFSGGTLSFDENEYGSLKSSEQENKKYGQNGFSSYNVSSDTDPYGRDSSGNKSTGGTVSFGAASADDMEDMEEVSALSSGIDSDSLDSSGGSGSFGGSVGSGGSGSFGGSGYMSGGLDSHDSDVVEGNVDISKGYFTTDDEERIGGYSAKTKSDTSAAFNQGSDRGSIIYRNILSGNKDVGGSSVSSLGLAGGAAGAGTAGAGALGSMLFRGLGSKDAADILNYVANLGKYTNLLDMVGKAERCSISWLGEINMVLAID